MHYFLGAVVLFTFLSNAVYAGTVQFTFGGTPVTLTTTANQDTFLTRLLTRENAARAVRTPPDSALTLEQYMRDIFVATVQGYKQQADTFEGGDFCTNYTAASPANKATVVGIGGGNKPPCP